MTTSTDLAIKYRSTDSLVFYARNARTHSDAQVDQIVESIREYGWTNPVLTDGENGIIAGHGRVLAAQKLGLERVPCVELSHLSEIQRRAYVIADNKFALNAGWDNELLRLELGELVDEGFDLELIGFDEAEFKELGWTPRIKEIPDDFDEIDESLATKYRCPKCGYEWSGSQT